MRRITDAFAGILLMLFLISAAVTLTLGARSLYYFDIGYLEIPEYSGYSEKEIRENYDVLIDYNQNASITKLIFPDFPMSEEAEIHFAEVKQIFQFIIKLFRVSGVLLIPLIIWKKKRREFGYLKAAGILTIVIPSVLGLAVALNWETAFELFHELLFQNDYWVFNPVTDPVINILPDEYFFHCAMLIFGMMVVGAVLCLGLYLWKKRHIRPHVWKGEQSL